MLNLGSELISKVFITFLCYTELLKSPDFNENIRMKNYINMD